ncbi:unnamed protein product [Colias eurytheme]|nr:unnamed protein product [Colias eurytheme]
MIWHRMKALRVSFQNNILACKDDAKTILEIEDCLKVYISLLDCLNSTGFYMKISLLRDLIYTLLYVLMLTVGTATKKSRSEGINYNMVFESVYQIVTFIFPCVMMELSRVEMEKIKLTIIEAYKVDSGQLSIKAEDAIRILDIRPFEYVISRLISIDIKLPIKFLSLITTYVFVTVQFTHVFG